MDFLGIAVPLPPGCMDSDARLRPLALPDSVLTRSLLETTANCWQSDGATQIVPVGKTRYKTYKTPARVSGKWSDMGNIQKRIDSQGKTHFRVQIRLKGFPPQSGTFERLTDAKKWVQQTEADMRAGRFFKVAESKRHTVGELIDRYLRDVMPIKRLSTRHNQVMHLTWWKERLGHLVLADLTPSTIAEARDELAVGTTRFRRVRSSSTVARYLAALSHSLTYAVKELGWIDDTPMRKVTRPKEARGVVRFLSDGERIRLLEACRQSKDRFLYPIVVLALCTGMRRSEIMNLTWDRIDFVRDAITLRSADTKNAEVRIVPLKGHAREALAELWKDRLSNLAFVFPAPTPPEGVPKPIDVESAWQLALKRADVRNFRFHDLRHSAASYLAMNGESPLVIAAVLGHKTLQMVKRYAHLSDTHMGAAVERMNATTLGLDARAGTEEEGGVARRAEATESRCHATATRMVVRRRTELPDPRSSSLGGSLPHN